jgi:hypothetical protein
MLAFRGGDYQRAVPALQAALDELNRQPAFETSVAWRVLVDNLGMAQGISGDRDKTITELKQAFALKANGIAGESMPNPATDDSFARFMTDRTFLAALDEIRTAGRMFPDRLDFTVSAVPWVLTVPAGDFEVSQSQQSPDGKQGYLLISNQKTGVTASFIIEPAVKCLDSRSCRDFVRTANLSKAPSAQNISSSEVGSVSVFEYLLPAFGSLPVRQQNMYAEYVRDGFWVDLHISKVQYRQEDHKLFEALINAVTFEAKK